MAIDDALDCGESDAGTWKFRSRVKPLKDAKQLPGVRHLESSSVVTNEERLVAGFQLPHLNHRFRWLRVNFQALRKRLSNTTRNRRSSPNAISPGAIRKSMERWGSVFRIASATSELTTLRSTFRGCISARPTRESFNRSSISRSMW
jgi:hypothetical protein